MRTRVRVPTSQLQFNNNKEDNRMHHREVEIHSKEQVQKPHLPQDQLIRRQLYIDVLFIFDCLKYLN